MATWHQQQNPAALRALWQPEEGKWKCVCDRPGQMAGCMVFDDRQKALDYCDNTGAVLVPPPAKIL